MDREAAARKEKAERDVAARKEKEERKAREKAEKEEAKRRKEEEKRKTREERNATLYTLAGGARGTGATEKTTEDKEPEETTREASTDIAGAGAAAAVLGTTGVVGHETVHHEDDQPDESVDREAAGSIPQTVGPHQTNIANILDPNVKPQPVLQKESEPLNFGDDRSDIAKIVDPRVNGDRKAS